MGQQAHNWEQGLNLPEDTARSTREQTASLSSLLLTTLSFLKLSNQFAIRNLDQPLQDLRVDILRNKPN
jgi:hypothetical protein